MKEHEASALQPGDVIRLESDESLFKYWQTEAEDIYGHTATVKKVDKNIYGQTLVLVHEFGNGVRGFLSQQIAEKVSSTIQQKISDEDFGLLFS